MELIINNDLYRINIIRKNNKNTYLRVKDNLEIQITTNHFMSDSSIRRFIDNNIENIIKMIEIQKRKQKKKESFYLLGNKYDIVKCDNFKKAYINEDKVYAKDDTSFDKFYKEYALKIFNERLKYNYDLFEENIPYPILKIRKMKAKWGYCRKVDNVVMLNIELIKHRIDEIDYVIVHELCHFIEFNHSASFWKYVKKYKPNYKENRKMLKE